jgi:hypothetical protein
VPPSRTRQDVAEPLRGVAAHRAACHDSPAHRALSHDTATFLHDELGTRGRSGGTSVSRSKVLRIVVLIAVVGCLVRGHFWGGRGANPATQGIMRCRHGVCRSPSTPHMRPKLLLVAVLVSGRCRQRCRQLRNGRCSPRWTISQDTGQRCPETSQVRPRVGIEPTTDRLVNAHQSQ